MASEWYYKRNGKQYGPLSASDMRQMADAGTLLPTDLVWRNGMDRPTAAIRMKGLFRGKPTAKDTVAELPTTSPNTKKTGMLESLKTAGTYAAKQAELTRLMNLSLPSAFHALGKAMFNANIGRVELQTEYSAVDQLQHQIAALANGADQTSVPQGFVQQAKAMAIKTADAAKAKLLHVRFDQALTGLGKAGFGNRSQLNLPRQEIDAIVALSEQCKGLESAIQSCAAEKPGQSLIKSFLPVLHVLLIPFLGLGLFLIFCSSLWSRKAKMIWAGSLACLFLLGIIGSVLQRNEMAVAVKEATVLWDGKKEGEAVEKYRAILNRHWQLLDKADRSTFIRRVVDFDSENINAPESAKALIWRALEEDLPVTFDHPLSQGLQRELQAELQQERKAKQLAQAEAVARRELLPNESFTAAQMQQISDDPNLKVVHSMGYLDIHKLKTYTEFKRNYEGDGNKLIGTGSYVQMLSMVPSEHWFRVAKKRGLSRTEFRQTTNLMFAAILASSGRDYDPFDEKRHNVILFEVTGKHLEDY